ncbi:MAG: DUF2442 domain-containing protein [Caulobacteraceae bacterium]
MSESDFVRTIKSAGATGDGRITLVWSDGVQAVIDVADILKDRRFAGLRDPAAFKRLAVMEWGHGVEWPTGEEVGADTLWLKTLEAIGRGDTRAFLEWRLRHGLSLSKAADALGLSRRTVAYYSNGDRPVPRAILLACRGWEADRAA